MWVSRVTRNGHEMTPESKNEIMTAIIGFNHLFIDSGSLTGPGYYAIQLLETALRLPEITRSPFTFKVFVQHGTTHHYSTAAKAHLIEVPALSGRVSRVLWEQFKLPLLAKREKVDLLFSPGFVSPAFGAPILATTIHDMYYRAVPDLVERYQRHYWRAMIPLTSRVCDLILTVSESSGRDIEHFLPAARGKVVVTPLASRFAPIEVLPPRPIGGTPYMLMIANLTPNKNVTRVVEALALLRHEGRNVDFVHIGVDLRDELAQAIATFGMQNHVRMLGKVDDATLVDTAVNSLCVVVPSLYEGFGMPAIEAHALGAPLVCSNRSALPEVAGDAALLVDPESPKSIAAAIAKLMDDPELPMTLQRKGLENVRNFSWDRTASLTLAAFTRQLNRKRK